MYPGLAQMARDVLAALVSGVGVERLFSYARDVCSHKRGSLDPQTISATMIVKYHDVLSHIAEDKDTEQQEGSSSLLWIIDSDDEGRDSEDDSPGKDYKRIRKNEACK